MSFHTTGAHYTAWQKQKLGWLLSDEMACIAGGGLEASLQPIESAGGLKSIALRVSPTRAIVAEVRRHIGRAAEDAAAGLTIDVVAEETPSFRIRIKKRS